MKNYVSVAAFLFLLAACKENKSSDTVKDDGFTTDTSYHYYPVAPPVNLPAFGVFDSTDFVKNKGAEVSRRELLFMSIDSTYSAISQIEIIKNEMNGQAVTKFSMQERNMRAKALNQLNLLENMLARQADETVLTNLKQHTDRLRAINEKTEANTEHLHELSDKLVRAGLIMQNVTNVLTFCVSKGVIKPATPVKATAADVKAGVN
jgi:hypothetical protein